MQMVMLIKLILMLVFFSQVVIFGKFISSLKCFTQGNIMNIAMTFSGTLFLSIALLDIIPQAISSFDQYFQQTNSKLTSSGSLHQNQYLPITMIICMITFMIIMYIDKILVGHSHDHEYEVSFIKQPRKSLRDLKMVEMKENHFNQEKAEQVQNNHNHNAHESQNNSPSSNTDSHDQTQKNYRPFILQTGMSIHSFFQCLAVGLQKSTMGVLSLAIAIVVHKWAEGLTLGLIYKKQGFSNKTTTIMIVIQGVVNVLGLVSGSLLIGQGHFVIAFFMSISAGTFMYISLAEVLIEQIHNMNKKKFFTVLAANSLIILIVFLEKFSEQLSEKQD